MQESINTLRIIFADGLCEFSTLIKEANKKQDVFLMMEVRHEFFYVSHHVKKIIFLLAAMRHFANTLTKKGYRVCYIKHNHPDNSQSFSGEIQRALLHYKPQKIDFITPGEYRVRKELLTLMSSLGMAYQEHHDPKFLVSHTIFRTWAKGKKNLQMEYFYRSVRKQFGILITDDKPHGGQWNYDAQNRQKAPENFSPMPRLTFPIDGVTQTVINELPSELNRHMGEAADFKFAVNRKQALQVLSHFIQNNLKDFGAYQDAMVADQPWMSHSHLSFYLNIGLLQPMECIEAALDIFEKGNVPLNSVEGFIRQILGWREYIRGVYWFYMPDYKNMNALNASQALPEWFWHGKTKMRCMQQCLSQTREQAYAHHIQRLMVIGNYCLLTGIEPKAVQDWYLAVYADAFEWVELPNVQGMILYADNGLVASKPYAASGAYINKMSNYCEGCQFSVKEKVGTTACPFNYLYWFFMDKHQVKLKTNHRLGFTLKQLEKMSAETLILIRQSAETWLKDNHF